MSTIRVFGVAGSLRSGAFNRMLLRSTQELAPEGMEIVPFERLNDLPHYNADVDAAGEPEPVATLRQTIRDANALLIISPEYNYNILGLLKNAIDWASRPPATSPLRGKPALLAGAAAGLVGTARAQLALRASFTFTQTYVLPAPEILVFQAQNKADAAGKLTDAGLAVASASRSCGGPDHCSRRKPALSDRARRARGATPRRASGDRR